MNKEKNSLMTNRKWYQVWDEHPHSTRYHWFIFILAVMIGSFVVNNAMLDTFRQEIDLASHRSIITITPRSVPTFAEAKNIEAGAEQAARANLNTELSALIKDRYIVVLKDTVSDAQIGAKDVGREHGLKLGHVYSHALKGFAAEISPEKLSAIKNNPKVAYIEKDGIAFADAQTLPTGVDRIDADRNTIAKINGIDERVDVDVAILDTGVDLTHPDLNVVQNVNFTTYGPDDVYGHGSHVAGIVAALDNDIGVVGVAPGARIHAVKVMGDNGGGTWSDVLEGIDWVTANASVIEVVNMSLGGPGALSSMRTAIQNSVNKGVVYMVAAMNDAMDIYGADGVFNTGDDEIPAAYPEVATISAMDPVSNYMASFSNYSKSVVTGNPVNSSGAGIDFAAPGVSIYSTYKNGGYTYMSGTSMASPHGAGLAALYVVKNGRANDAAGVARIRQALINIGEAQSLWGPANTGDPDANKENLGDAEPIAPDLNKQPTVSIADPAGGATIAGVYRVKISAATSGGTIAKVEFAVDSGSYINITANFDGVNYYYDWTTNAASEGSHALKARATDNVGSSKDSSIISVNVDNIDNLPTVSFTKPVNGGTVSKTTLIQVSATDDRGPIVSAEYAIDTGAFKPLAYNSGTSMWEANLDTTAIQEGSHTITAQAKDNAGQNGATSITVAVDNTPPSAAITNPAPESILLGSVKIQVDASDLLAPVGTLALEYAIDAGAWQPTTYNSSSAKYEAMWTSTTTPNGMRAITARATDKGNNIGTAPVISVDIENGNINNMYVWDIAWQETVKKGKNASITLKVPVTVRRDSNANKIADNSDVIVENVSVTMLITAAGTDGIFGTSDDKTLNSTATTSTSGIATVTWQNALRGQYKAQVMNLTNASYQWNSALDADNPSLYTTK